MLWQSVWINKFWFVDWKSCESLKFGVYNVILFHIPNFVNFLHNFGFDLALRNIKEKVRSIYDKARGQIFNINEDKVPFFGDLSLKKLA